MSKTKKPIWIATTKQAAWQTRSLPRSTGRSCTLRATGQRDQTITGFGGCFNELGHLALSALPKAGQHRIMRELFDPTDGCRFNLCRVPIGASDYAAQWYSCNEHDGDFAMKRFTIQRDRKHLIPYIQLAQRFCKALTLFASPWSPPTWMKHPAAYNYGRLLDTPKNLTAYALYFAKFVDAYAREGIRIAQVHPQNEPVADQKFPSCVWPGNLLAKFIGRHLAPTFRRRKLDCEIWLGTLNTDDYDGYVHTVLADAAANKAITGVGFQWAGKGAIQRTHQSWPEKRLMQTENECGDGQNTWAYAGYVFDLMQHYITNGAESYIYWNMILPPNGESTWGRRQNSMITIDPGTKKVVFTPEFYVMKHASRFVDPGAVRLELAGPWAGNAIAFENPDRSTACLVRNPLPRQRMLRFDSPGGTITAQLPPDSINTLVLPAPGE